MTEQKHDDACGAFDIEQIVGRDDYPGCAGGHRVFGKEDSALLCDSCLRRRIIYGVMVVPELKAGKCRNYDAVTSDDQVQAGDASAPVAPGTQC